MYLSPGKLHQSVFFYKGKTATNPKLSILVRSDKLEYKLAWVVYQVLKSNKIK